MKKNLNSIASALLITGLMAPNALHAGVNWSKAADNAVQGAAISTGIHLAAQPAKKLGAYIADSIEGHEGKIILGAAIAIAAYYVYTSRETKSEIKNQRANSCGKKGCSHKGCK